MPDTIGSGTDGGRSVTVQYNGRARATLPLACGSVHPCVGRVLLRVQSVGLRWSSLLRRDTKLYRRVGYTM